MAVPPPFPQDTAFAHCRAIHLHVSTALNFNRTKPDVWTTPVHHHLESAIRELAKLEELIIHAI